MHMVNLDYRDARPIYAQIIDGFRDQILSGVLENGDKLPSVRELALQLAINPNTIQRAYRELEMQGWIATVPGKGCFVCGVPQMTDREQQPLLDSFDKAAAALLQLGMTPEQLIQRIQQGGKENA
jgi:GntR family transcriptional regulator